MTRRVLLFAAVLIFVAVSGRAQVSTPAAAVTSGGAPRGVTLALTEYNRLSDLASSASAATPPVAAVLSTADLRVRVDNGTALGEFALTGEVFQRGATRVTLVSNATVLDATAGSQPLPLLTDGRAHDAVVFGPGPFSASLQWGTPLTMQPGRASFVVPSPRAGMVRATIDVPGEQADVRLSAGVITQRTVQNGRTSIEATLDPGTPAEVSWSMRDSTPVAAARDAKTVAEVLTLITLGDAETRMLALIDLTVLRGEPRSVDLELPAGYRLTGITGTILDVAQPAAGRAVVTVAEPAARRHQFLVSLEQPHKDGTFTFDTGFVAVGEVQRERGEAAVEGVGTLDLKSTATGDMHRVDIRELNPALVSLGRTPLLAGFRYQRTAAAAPRVTLNIDRFGDSSVLAASVDSARATTLITSQGRALTEVALSVQNHAQPFLKVILPAGASIVSVAVAGEPAKPVVGSDGTRVPLLRPGFRPAGAYAVSFVYLHAGAPLAKKGAMSMALPRMDIPIGVVSWEVFAPEAYRMNYVGGNALSTESVTRASGRSSSPGPAPWAPHVVYSSGLQPTPGIPAGRVEGIVRDTTGAVLPGVTVELSSPALIEKTRQVTTDMTGHFAFNEIPSGSTRVLATLAGFRASAVEFYLGGIGQQINFMLQVGAIEETIAVTSSSSRLSAQTYEPPREVFVPPSADVVGIQQRVAGVLPIPIDVPHAGTSYNFSRALVLDDETHVDFRYKKR